METRKSLIIAIGIVALILCLAMIGTNLLTKNSVLAAASVCPVCNGGKEVYNEATNSYQKCTNCNGRGYVGDIHNHFWQQNGGFYHECAICHLKEACNLVTDISAIDENSHSMQRCSVCNAVWGAQPHNYQWDCDTTHHWKQCKDCGYLTNFVAHQWYNGVCGTFECAYECQHPGQTGNVCNICGKTLNTQCTHTNGYDYIGFTENGEYKHEVVCIDRSCPNYGRTIRIENCTEGAWTRESYWHLVNCSKCNQNMVYGSHTDRNNDGVCDKCGYVMEVQCDHPASMLIWQSNDTHHWAYCTKCNKEVSDRVEHSYSKNEGNGICACGYHCKHLHGTHKVYDTENHYDVCDDCGYKLSSTQHTLTDWTNDPANNCHIRHCLDCDYYMGGPHDIVTDAKREPTCTEKGLTEGKHCSKCGLVTVAQQEIPATGHTYGEWEITRQATCKHEGAAIRRCTKCDATENGIIEKLEHKVVIDEKKDATCTENGLTEGKHCSECGEIIVAQEVIPALGHDYRDWKDNGDGTHTGSCVRCGDQKREEHNLNEENECKCGYVKENEPINNQPAENQPVEHEPAENEPAENEPAENEPAENEPAENEPAENEAAENKPEENKAEGSKQAENKPAENKQEENKQNESKKDEKNNNTNKTENSSNNTQAKKNLPFTGDKSIIIVPMGIVIIIAIGIGRAVKFKMF